MTVRHSETVLIVMLEFRFSHAPRDGLPVATVSQQV